MPFAPRKSLLSLGVFLSLAACVVITAPAAAQNPPGLTIEHYRVRVVQPITVPDSFGLRDQFISTDHVGAVLELVGIPVDKQLEGITDPITHYMWYRLLDSVAEPTRNVIITNQFGQRSITTGNAAYLLNPAVKNVPAPDPDTTVNHYKCYDILEDGPDVTVSLADQFHSDLLDMGPALFLCNPTRKQHNGQTYVIVKPVDHLVCYEISGPSPDVSAVYSDQFLFNHTTAVLDQVLLCVPSLKEEPVQTEESSWGRMKSLYR